MDFEEYRKEAQRTAQELPDFQAQATRACFGLAGELGEVIEQIKKNIYQNRPIDYDKVVKECGDVQWYFADLLTALGINANTVLEQNIKKLRTRYPEGYSHERAASENRLDEIGGKVRT